MVHVEQFNGLGSAPGGLIEGIADWVRNENHLDPPHWKEGPGEDENWDAGYQTTVRAFAQFRIIAPTLRLSLSL